MIGEKGAAMILEDAAVGRINVAEAA